MQSPANEASKTDLMRAEQSVAELVGSGKALSPVASVGFWRTGPSNTYTMIFIAVGIILSVFLHNNRGLLQPDPLHPHVKFAGRLHSQWIQVQLREAMHSLLEHANQVSQDSLWSGSSTNVSSSISEQGDGGIHRYYISCNFDADETSKEHETASARELSRGVSQPLGSTSDVVEELTLASDRNSEYPCSLAFATSRETSCLLDGFDPEELADRLRDNQEHLDSDVHLCADDIKVALSYSIPFQFPSNVTVLLLSRSLPLNALISEAINAFQDRIWWRIVDEATGRPVLQSAGNFSGKALLEDTFTLGKRQWRMEWGLLEEEALQQWYPFLPIITAALAIVAVAGFGCRWIRLAHSRCEHYRGLYEEQKAANSELEEVVRHPDIPALLVFLLPLPFLQLFCFLFWKLRN